MRSYWTDELTAELPKGFLDRSTHALEWEVDGATVSLLLQRDATKERLSPDAFTAATRSEYEKRFAHFFPEEPPELDLRPLHALLAFRWKRDASVVYQLQVAMDLGDRTLIVTATGPAKSRAFVDDLVSTFAQTLEVRAP